MPSQQDQSPFTFVLSNVLLVMMAIFLVSNIAFISGCVSASRTTGDDLCKISDIVESLGAVIPAIKRPVIFLHQAGNHERAELVGSVYSFAWATAIATAAAMIFTALATTMLLSDDSRRATKEYFERMHRHRTLRERDQASKGMALFALIAILPFWHAFWGDFDFSSSRPPSFFINTVHVSDRDLYRLSILLAFLLFSFILPLIVCARNIVLKSWEGQEPSSPPRLSA
jgi:hypothetical protein